MKTITIKSPRWLDAAPLDEMEPRDFFVRLITFLAQRVDQQTLDECIAESLPSHGVKRTGSGA
jgi:hypothetical protein